MPPYIDPEKCTRCGVCVDICNSHIFTQDAEKQEPPVVKFPEECWHCNSCVIDCKTGAIQLRIPLTHSLLYSDAYSINHINQKED